MDQFGLWSWQLHIWPVVAFALKPGWHSSEDYSHIRGAGQLNCCFQRIFIFHRWRYIKRKTETSSLGVLTNSTLYHMLAQLPGRQWAAARNAGRFPQRTFLRGRDRGRFRSEGCHRYTFGIGRYCQDKGIGSRFWHMQFTSPADGERICANSGRRWRRRRSLQLSGLLRSAPVS
jgi:hypothetical protein